MVAITIALIQYNYILSTNNQKKRPWMALLRAATVFCILLLLISPSFEQTSYTSVRPQLILLADDSRSIKALQASTALKNDVEELFNDADLNNKFDIIAYKFSKQIDPLDSLSFEGSATDIATAIARPQKLFKDRNKALVILTDGNQTIGQNYQYSTIDNKSHIYPVVYGDTASYPDVFISQLNVNRYSYVNNSYPIEIFINYKGEKDVNSLFTIEQGSQVVFKKTITLSKNESSIVINTTLTSKQVGVQNMTARIEPLINERNTINNSRNFAIEVIDEQSKILLLSDLSHPDIGALKKAITSNRQRTVDIKNPTDSIDYNAYDLIIQYGLSSAFAKANKTITDLQKNTWLLLGPEPDLNYLNQQKDAYQMEEYKQTDQVQPAMNESYSRFDLTSYDYEDYPPVRSPFGQTTINVPYETLFYKKIGAVVTNEPLWFTYDQGDSRHAVFLGSGLWRWRSQSYLDAQNFTNFDDLINSQVQLLASKSRRDRLQIDAAAFYYENDPITISAQLLDQNYEFDRDGVLNITLKSKETGATIEQPFIKSGNSYTVDLSGIESGEYDYVVRTVNENLERSGSFTVLKFDIEKQFVNASFDGLLPIATNDKVYLRKEMQGLKTTLLNDPLLTDIERSELTYQSLIDWKFLLFLIALLVGLEWFLRKYNGLI